MRRGLFWAVLAAALTSACAPQERPLTEEDMKAQFAWDLGPNTIEIYAYPADKKDDYALFRSRCSRCHTLARPINAPYASRENWTEYVKKMNKRSGNVLLAADEEKRIVDFLVFDAKQRKTKPEFQAEGKQRDELFERVKEARAAAAPNQK